MNNITNHSTVKPLWKRFDILWVACLGLVFVAMSFDRDLVSADRPLVTAWFVATFVSISASLGFWIGFGKSWTRFISAGMALLLLTLVMARGLSSQLESELFLCLAFGLVVTLTIALPIWLVRYWKSGNLVVRHTQESTEALQFTITHLFIFMTAAGILTGVTEAIRETVHDNQWLFISMMGATLGICSVVVIWSTLGNTARRRTLVSAVVAIELALLSWVLNGGVQDGWIWIAVTVAVWAKITVLMWLVRIQGYRFVANSTE